MIIVSKAPLFEAGKPGVERMGDPIPNPNDTAYVVFPFPFPQGAVPTYASWPVGATEWQSRSVIDESCSFQLSSVEDGDPKNGLPSNHTIIEAERGGPIAWFMKEGFR